MDNNYYYGSCGDINGIKIKEILMKDVEVI